VRIRHDRPEDDQSMYPILGEPFGIPIRSFGVMVALAFVLALWASQREARRTGRLDPEVVGDLLLWVMVGGILGARVLYCIVHWPDQFAHQPIELLKVWKGGLVSYGGFFGGFFGGWLFTRRRKIDFVTLGDTCMAGLMLGQAIGRIGCLLVGDDHGGPTDVPWAITFPDVRESLMPADLIGVPVHPTQLYLLMQAFTIFLILSWIARRATFHGQVFYWGLILYPIGRSICEVFRADDSARGIYYGVSTAQWISIPIFFIGVIGLTRAAKAGRPLSASPLPPSPDPRAA